MAGRSLCVEACSSMMRWTANMLITVLLFGPTVPYTAVMLTEEQEDSHTCSAGVRSCSAVLGPVLRPFVVILPLGFGIWGLGFPLYLQRNKRSAKTKLPSP